MSEEFEALLGGTASGDDAKGADAPAPDETAMVTALREILGALEIPSVSGSSLTVRGRLIDRWRFAKRVEEAARMARQTIELAFVRAGAENGSDQIPTPQGVVTLKAPATEYDVRPDPMKRALLKLAAKGLVSEKEIDEALPVTIVLGANNAKLNYLARHRGKEVEDAIERHRTRKPTDPLRARPEFPKGGPT